MLMLILSEDFINKIVLSLREIPVWQFCGDPVLLARMTKNRVSLLFGRVVYCPLFVELRMMKERFLGRNYQSSSIVAVALTFRRSVL